MHQVLAVTAGLLCGLYGWRTAAHLQREATNATRWSQLLPHLALLLEEAVLPLPRALHLTADGNGTADRVLQAIAQTLESNPLVTPQEAYSNHAPQPSPEPLMRLFRQISRGSAEQRALATRQCAQEMALLAQAARERAGKDVKLLRTLGWTGGACLTLLLL